MKLINAASEFNGRLIAYGGGTGVWALSSDVVANTKAVITTAPSSISSFVALGGLVIVVARFAFDVYKYFDQRKLKKLEQEPEE